MDRCSYCEGGMMEVLHLTLKRKWFDMILSGEKKEEYRELKSYWHKRLANKRFDVIRFRNGYSKTARAMTVEIKEICIGLGILEWGAKQAEKVYILKLGNVIEQPTS